MSKAPGMDGYVKTRWGFFVREGESEIDDNYTYSDGREIEENILSILKNAKDLSSLSVELQKKIIDWPTSYYLSPRRANLLRPVESLLQGRVLEVGAGCGALTRYLGEVAQDVVAIEGSAARASAAVERVRDLKNSTVVRSLIQDFRSDEPFDAVICVGVLEYARVYVDSPEPELTLLNMMRSNLTPDGVLILAIENQLGLKYFSGSLEDHYGAPFFGVNDSYRRDGVTTFGRVELSRLLRKAGFESLEVLAPLPDYKLPVSVVRTESDIVSEDIKSRLLEQSVYADQQNAAHPTFSLERAWPVVNRNGLLPDLANSFLLVASRRATVQDDVSAWHYSVDRHPAFAKETRFITSEGALQIRRRALSAEVAPDVPLTWDIGHSPHIVGTNWWTECVRILNTEGWGLPDLVAWARVWVDALRVELGIPAGSDLFDVRVDGRAFDLVPENLIVNEQGAHFFDVEWRIDHHLPLGVVMIRGLRDSVAKVSSCAYTASDVTFKVNELVLAILAGLGVLVSKTQLNSMCEFDLRVQAWIRGDAAAVVDYDSVERDWSRVLTIRNPADRDLLSYHLNEARNDLVHAVESGRTEVELLQSEHSEALLFLEQILQDVTQQLHASLKAAARDQSAMSEDWKTQQGAFEAKIEELSEELVRERSLSASALAEGASLRSELEAMSQAAVLARESHIRALQEADDFRQRAAQAEKVAGQLQDAHDRQMEKAEAWYKAEVDRVSQAGELERESYARALQQADELSKRVAAEAEKVAEQLQQAHDRQMDKAEAWHRAELDRVSQIGVLERESYALALREHDRQIEKAEARHAVEVQNAVRAFDLERETYVRALQEAEGIGRRIAAEAEHVAARLQKEHDLAIAAAEARRESDLERASQTAAAERERHARDLTASELRAQALIDEAQRSAATSLEASIERERALLTELSLRDRRLRACVDIIEALRYLGSRLRVAERRLIEAELLTAKLYSHRLLLRASEQHEKALPAMSRRQDKSTGGVPVNQGAREVGDKSVSSDGKSDIGRFFGVRGHVAARNSQDNFKKFLSQKIRRVAKFLKAAEKSRSISSRSDIELLRNAGLVRSEYYIRRNPDVPADDVAVLRHYFSKEGGEGAAPHPVFDPAWYWSQSETVADEDVDPIIHYLERGWLLGRSPHPLFDSAWYLAKNPDVSASGVNPVTHYLRYGWREGRNPHPLFDGEWYMRQEPALMLADVDPLTHYLEEGWLDRRSPHPLFNAVWYDENHPDVSQAGMNPLVHYVQNGWREGRLAHPLFDAAAYLKHNPDVAEAAVDPLQHYVEHGWREGRCPHPLFNIADYMEPHRVANNAVGGGLVYFVRGGWRDGISPHPQFDLQWYLSQNPTLSASGYQDPLSHYVAVGSRLGMSASPVLNEDAIKNVAGEDPRPALLIFMDGLENQNDFTLTKKNRWSKAEYAKYKVELQSAADRLNRGV